MKETACWGTRKCLHPDSLLARGSANVNTVMVIGIDRKTGNASLAKDVGRTCALIKWSAQDRVGFQICELVNAKSGITVAREIGLPTADQERVSRRIDWIELERTDRQCYCTIHQRCPR